MFSLVEIDTYHQYVHILVHDLVLTREGNISLFENFETNIFLFLILKPVSATIGRSSLRRRGRGRKKGETKTGNEENEKQTVLEIITVCIPRFIRFSLCHVVGGRFTFDTS